MISIVISEKGGSERREHFEQDEVSVGRVQGNDLVLPKGNVSKRHCKLSGTEGRYVVTDLGSTNGSYVNRRRIAQATVVREGDRIYVGDFVLRIESAVPASEDSAAPPRNPAVSPASPRGGELRDQASFASAGALPNGELDVADERVSAVPTTTSSGFTLGGGAVQAAGWGPAGREATLGALTQLVEQTLSRLGERELRREPDEDLSRRADRTVREQSNVLGKAGAIPDGVEAEDLVALALQELLATGPLEALLADDSVTELTFAGAGHVAVCRGAQVSQSELPFCTAAGAELALERFMRQEGLEAGDASPLLRLAVPRLGLELEVIRGPRVAAAGPLIRLRRPPVLACDFEELVRAGSVSRALASFLDLCVAHHANILVVGPEHWGIDFLLAALAGAAPDERCIVAARTGRVGLLGDAGIGLDVAGIGEPELSALIKTASRLPKSRLLVDDLGGDTAMATLNALSAGAQGVIAMLRGGTVERAVAGLCANVCLGKPGLGVVEVSTAVQSAFDVVLEVSPLEDGRSRVMRACEPASDFHVTRYDAFYEFRVDAVGAEGAVDGSFRSTGLVPRFAEALRRRGVDWDDALFSRL